MYGIRYYDWFYYELTDGNADIIDYHTDILETRLPNDDDSSYYLILCK